MSMNELTDEDLVRAATAELGDYLAVAQGHGAVHPDRDECGGVGGCILLRAEVDQEHEMTELLRAVAARGLRLRISLDETC